MKMHSSHRIAVAALAAIAAFGQTVSAATAAETFKAHEAEIATNRCVAVGGFVFGVGRAISKNGGDSVGFGKARLLAFGKIADMAKAHAPWPDGATPKLRDAAWRIAVARGEFLLSLEGCETILERREAPDRYMAVVAVPESGCGAAVPDRAALERMIAAVAAGTGEKHVAETPPADHETPEEYEPRGYWEESGVKINETMADGQF